MKEVGIWIRVSTEDQAQGDSPAHHEERAKMFVEMRGWKVKEVYHLEAVSGKTVSEHPETKRMLKDIKSGHITGLVFSKLARLARNTRELLDFATYFEHYKADLISLQESIDTSNPAGKFFYTLLSAMAEWERGEIASRVKASIPVRAKLGKSLGGEAPYGYRWVNKQLQLDEKEAIVRKLMFELFLKQKRVLTVAKELNSLGHRTRNGSMFSGTTVDRLLKDPIAKGLRRVNYTRSTGDGKHWEMKDKEDWVFQHVQPILTEQLWEDVNQILIKNSTSKEKVRRTSVHLFSGVLFCHCGGKMYMRSQSPRYVCQECFNKILPEDIEEIFHGELKKFLYSDDQIQKQLDAEKAEIGKFKAQIEIHENKSKELQVKIDKLFDLYFAGEIQKNGFDAKHSPLQDEKEQNDNAAILLQAQIDNLSIQTLSNSQLLYEARDLHSRWDKFTREEKQVIIQTVVSKITVYEEKVELKFKYLPTTVSEEVAKKLSAKPSGGINMFILPTVEEYAEPLSKFIQLFHTGMPLWLL